MTGLPDSVHTVVIGAGHAGLIMSRHLRDAGREHLVLDRRPTLGGGWLDRWDAFQLVTPNFLTDLPGFRYDGSDPDGYMTRDEIAGRIAAYAGAIDAPVVLGATARRLTAEPSSRSRFRLETDRGTVLAFDVVVATGAFHTPRIPSTAEFGPRIHQLHAHHYRNEAALPAGGVLVVGSGQTGVQLAEELHAAGRSVTLSVGHCGRAPRRYRGRDFFWWLRQIVLNGAGVGTPLPTVETLPDPRARFACNPHLSGHGGGHDTNLRRFAADGIRLVGRFEGADGERARFAADLASNLEFADEFFDQRFKSLFDTFAERAGIEASPDDRVPFRLDVPEVTELDLSAEGISTVLWTTGYAPDYGWLSVPVLGEFGLPRHLRGISEVPGLTFIGLLWQHTQASANLGGVATDAEYLASRWDA
ncbi:MAG: NAD(P)/FAD-dependent oxidoreductase [Chloroflexota bacterium]|nr:NAD(P)/FAD-dependent oxidoreductase [Chloroflexota bacterium]